MNYFFNQTTIFNHTFIPKRRLPKNILLCTFGNDVLMAMTTYYKFLHCCRIWGIESTSLIWKKNDHGELIRIILALQVRNV